MLLGSLQFPHTEGQKTRHAVLTFLTSELPASPYGNKTVGVYLQETISKLLTRALDQSYRDYPRDESVDPAKVKELAYNLSKFLSNEFLPFLNSLNSLAIMGIENIYRTKLAVHETLSLDSRSGEFTDLCGYNAAKNDGTIIMSATNHNLNTGQTGNIFDKLQELTKALESYASFDDLELEANLRDMSEGFNQTVSASCKIAHRRY